MNDVIETTLLNMFFASTVKTMLLTVKSRQGNFDLVCLMGYIYEKDIINFIEKNNIKSMDGNCEFLDKDKYIKFTWKY